MMDIVEVIINPDINPLNSKDICAYIVLVLDIAYTKSNAYILIFSLQDMDILLSMTTKIETEREKTIVKQ